MNRNEKILTEIKSKLSQLYANLPQQFALETTKYHIKKALESIDIVETKRQKRMQVQQQPVGNMVAFNSIESAKAALKILDGMIQNEKANVEKAQSIESKLLNG